MFRKLLLLFLSAMPLFSYAEQINTPKINTFIADVTAKGAKITAVVLEYQDNILSGSDLRQLYQVTTSFDKEDQHNRHILRAYINDKPEKSSKSQIGKFVIIEFDDRDENADFYNLKIENNQKMNFKARDENGKIISVEKIQSQKIPQFYEDNFNYMVKQMGVLKLTNGATLEPFHIKDNITRKNIKINYIDDFLYDDITLDSLDNKLLFRFYKPRLDSDKKYPLTLFLHGSGQVGKDNIAHLLSSKGAISTLQYEDGFVIAPQYDAVFDPFDKVGIHWQTNNRHQLVFKMLDKFIQQNPNIDRNRIYIIGLSRGAEGGLYLLQKRPNFFAGALLMSGREANSIEWIDGNATVESLYELKDKPIWFFHSIEDKISPIKGSAINFMILKEQLKSKNVRYTEFTMKNSGDNGIINNNPHNTWDAVFNSPEIIQWLLSQNLSK